MTRREAILLPAAALAAPASSFFKGVNFTAEGPGGYSPESARKVLQELPGFNVNSIAMVPYGFTRQGLPDVRFGGGGLWERDADIEKLAALAHGMGFRVMLKPQIWVRPGWPGDLEFPNESDRVKWFGAYRKFVEHYAGLAQKIRAEVFCVGTEFGKLTRYEKEWRVLVACARDVFSGKLTYAALQGPEFETITFWDALDYIGLNNYYPIPDGMNMAPIVAKVEGVHRQFRKPVIFPEAGFCSFEAPNRAPWDETPRKLSMADQARCYEAVLRAFYHKPWFHGVFWWKVGTNGRGGPTDGSHTPWRKPAMDVVKRWYAQR